MDEWRYVKKAVKWGLTSLLVCWVFNIPLNLPIVFGVMGTGGFISSVLEGAPNAK